GGDRVERRGAASDRVLELGQGDRGLASGDIGADADEDLVENAHVAVPFVTRRAVAVARRAVPPQPGPPAPDASHRVLRGRDATGPAGPPRSRPRTACAAARSARPTRGRRPAAAGR